MVLLTGVGRTVGIAAGIAQRLATSGWDVAMTWWSAYDERMPWGAEHGGPAAVESSLRERGARTAAVEADLSDPTAPDRVFDEVEAALGPVTALVMCHCESVDSSILDTTVESFDRHFAVNARATWLLVREHARRLRVEPGTGRIVALTSDHTTHNLPYGASKGALDRIVLAAAEELAHLALTSNVVNPGTVDTGWMDEGVRASGLARTPLGRAGTPQDTADLVEFLLSARGGWITGQLLKSNGGYR